MIFGTNDPSSGLPPMPVTSLTVEQEFTVRRIEDMLPKASKEDISELLISLQKQNFCLVNTIKELLKR